MTRFRQIATSGAVTANILLLLFSLLICLLVVEFVLRFHFAINHTKQDWSDRPERYYLAQEEKPARDYIVTPRKADDVFRIVVIGDSFTYPTKMQFIDSFPKRLEWALNLNKQTKVEVINRGVRGYSAMHANEEVRKTLALLDPDLIILQITLNDPEDTPYQISHADKIATWKAIQDSWTYKNIKLFAKIRETLHAIRSQQEFVDYHHALFYQQRTWNHWRNALNRIKARTDQAKVPVVAVVFPLFAYPLGEAYPARLQDVHGRIGRYLDHLEWQWLDLRSAYAGIPSERLVVEPAKDTHPNEIAHRIAADTILEWLNTNQLIPNNSYPKYTAVE